MLKRCLSLVFFYYLAQTPLFAADREIAITLDDLPFVGSGTNTPANLKRTQERFMAIVNALVINQIPATGFIIGGAVAKNEWELLEIFRKNGLNLGNHTYTHMNLNTNSAEKYIADIDKADKHLQNIMTTPKYFRFPFLAEGKGEKKQKVKDYLSSHQYIVAPVTIDSKDYEFNARFYKIAYRNRLNSIKNFKKGYLAFIWKQTLRAEKQAQNKNNGQTTKHILLLHANLLNSLCLGDIIQLYRQNGYKFISLAEALENPTAKTVESASLHSVIPSIPKEIQLRQSVSVVDTHLNEISHNVVSITSNILYFSYGLRF